LCPAGTSSPAGSDALSDCICTVGYNAGSDGVACSACEAGTYKSTPGTGECSSCPEWTNSSTGSDDLNGCICVAGYTAMSNGVACSPCVAGTFKSTTGTGACSSVCPAGTSSPAGSDALSDCICDVGYTAESDGVACSACDAGKYKSMAGTGECSSCPAGTNSSTGSDDLNACICVAGYTAMSDGVACSPCGAGTFKLTRLAPAMSAPEYPSRRQELPSARTRHLLSPAKLRWLGTCLRFGVRRQTIWVRTRKRLGSIRRWCPRSPSRRFPHRCAPASPHLATCTLHPAPCQFLVLIFSCKNPFCRTCGLAHTHV